MRTIILPIFSVLFSITSIAQVPVNKEPRHHVVFENDQFRILNVLIPPGDTTQYHIHSTPSVFISFTKNKIGSQLINKTPVAGIPGSADIWFENLNPPHTKIHRVWNMDTFPYHVMDIELLTKDSGFNTGPLKTEHVALAIDTGWVRVYKIKLAKNEQVAIKDQKSGFILVAINDATIDLNENKKETKSLVKAGAFYIIKLNDQFSVTNPGDSTANFALLEIK
jgi:hypothetical protein